MRAEELPTEAGRRHAARMEMALLEVNVDVRGQWGIPPGGRGEVCISLAPWEMVWRASALSKMSRGKLTSCYACYNHWPNDVDLRREQCLDRRLGPQVLDCGAARPAPRRSYHYEGR